jgi:F420-dependent oxidoreductase-like protein
VVEGWYGQSFAKPLARTREYVGIVRKVLAREERVTNDGPHYPLPHPGGLGLGKPLRSITHPLRADVPIILGAEGPKNVALAAEIADGWFPLFFSPRHDHLYKDSLAEGFNRPGARRTPDDFEVLATVTVVIDDDVEKAADALRPMAALYIGGMGAQGMNFHFDVFCRLGYEAEAHKIQELYLDGHQDDAIAAVPTRMVEEMALIGPVDKIRDELELWKSSIVTTMLLGTRDAAMLRTMAELVL